MTFKACLAQNTAGHTVPIRYTRLYAGWLVRILSSNHACGWVDILDQARFVAVWTRFAKRFSYDCCTVPSTVCYGLLRPSTIKHDFYSINWTFTGFTYGLVRSHTVSHGLVRSLIRLYTDRAPVSAFYSFKNHTRLSRIHSNGRSVTRIRPRLVRLYLRFTRTANRNNRVFCLRQA